MKIISVTLVEEDGRRPYHTAIVEIGGAQHEVNTRCGSWHLSDQSDGIKPVRPAFAAQLQREVTKRRRKKRSEDAQPEE